MAAPKGNQFWKARSSHGRNPKFASPEQLWDACEQYFQWVEDNPLMASELVKYQGKAKVKQTPRMRAMTIGGLCIFLDIAESTWDQYRMKDGFSGVTTRAEKIIYAQKFQGAAADLLNANIIARDLALADRQELSGPNGGPIETEELSKREKARRIAFALNKGKHVDG